METTSADWQAVTVLGLRQLSESLMPAMELLYLDLLAAHLMGPEAPQPPYTIEHGTKIVSLLLQAAKDAPLIAADLASSQVGGPSKDPYVEVARTGVVTGAHGLADNGSQGAQRLASRFLPAVVGELEHHQSDPQEQVRALFYYGLLAIASGPENKTNAAVSDGVMAAFYAWDARIGEGFVPPWRVVAAASS